MQHLFSLRETAALLGICPDWLYDCRKSGQYPEPTRGDGVRKFYSFEDVALMRKIQIKRRQQKKKPKVIKPTWRELGLYSKLMASKELGITYECLCFRIGAGAFAEPTRGDFGRKYYSREDVEKMKERLASWRPTKVDNFYLRVRKSGMYSISGAAEFHKMPVITLRSKIDRGAYPRPTRLVRGFLCYSRKDLKENQKKYLAGYVYTPRPKA